MATDQLVDIEPQYNALKIESVKELILCMKKLEEN